MSWGLFWGGWSALIPAVKSDLALTDEQLGLALFAVPIAAVPAMLLTGRLAQRLAQHTLPAVTAAFAVGCLLVGLASSRWTFTAALLLVGVASGGIEVALNATLAAREARDGVRLFNKVHAATPLAMVGAAAGVGLARSLGVSPRVLLTVIAVLVALSAVLAIDRRPWQDAAPVPDGGSPGRISRPLVLVGAVGAVVLLMENSVEQWGAIHLAQQLAAGPFLAACGPAVYMTGLAVGRILAQWQGERFDDGTLVRVGGALGGIGLAVAAAGWNVPWTLTGYALAGIGLAPVVPGLLGAVGRAVGPDRRSRTISAVTTVAYAGFLASPPLVGVLAGGLGLPTALGLVALGGVLVVTGAHAVRLLPVPVPDPDPTGEETRS